MAAYSNYKIWFWDDALVALGSTTNVISARYRCGIDNIGEGEFVIPLVDTKARQWCVKYNIATFTCDIDGNTVCFGEIVIDRGDEVIRQGQPGLFVVRGLGRLSKLKIDRTNYQIISDGSGGAVNTAVADILALSQYATWNISQSNFGAGSSNPTAYLVTANETLFDTTVQALLQENHHIVDQPGQENGALDTAETPENRVYLKHQMDDLSSSTAGFTSWHFLVNADDTSNVEMPILSITPILEEKETVTIAYIHGGGLGSGQFTINAASGTRAAPAGYSYDFNNSTITNTALEAVSNQPRVAGLAKMSNIKPEDPTDATSVQSAAEQLVDAGQRWMEERVGDYDEYYRIESIAKYQTNAGTSFVAWPGYISGVRLTFSKVSPYDTSDALNDTTIIDVDKVMHLLEAEYSVSAGTGPNDGKLMGNYLLGPAPRQERSGGELVADEIKELKRRLDHADASAGTSTTPAGTTYVTTDAPLVTATSSAALANERVLTAGDGVDVTDGGAGTTITVAVDVTDILGNGLTETANNIVLGTPTTLTVSTTNNVGASTHAHAITSSADPTGQSLLASDADGRTGLEGLGILTAPDGDYIKVADGVAIGLGAAAGRIVFDDQTTDQIELLSANVLINGETLDGNITAGLQVLDTNALISDDGGSGAKLSLINYAASPFAGVRVSTSRGSRGTPTATQADDILGQFGAGGYDGTSITDIARGFIRFRASENFSNGVGTGTYAEIGTTPDSSETATVKMTIADDGDLTLLTSANTLSINATTGGNAATSLNFEWPDVSTNTARIRIFRNTSTSGTREVVIFRGDGTATNDHTFTANGGYQVGTPTGGDKGVGTINAAGDIYKNNSAYTNPDYALELWANGHISLNAHKPGARDYQRLTLGEVEQYIRQNLRLPGITDKPAGMFERGDFLLEKIEEVFTYLIELEHKIEAL